MKHGFTLIELAIVLVIVGLLVGGVIAGQSLIRAAELRTIVKDIEAYRTAVFSFKERYQAIPGDMRNATDFWGAADANHTTCKTTVGVSDATCNGDGDGKVGTHSASQAEKAYESFRFWQHLANAGLIKGIFTGIAGTGGDFHDVAGENIPASAVKNSGYTAYWIPPVSATLSVFAGNYGNIFFLGGNTSGGRSVMGFISAEEAWGIDTKLDDGRPGSGIIKTQPNSRLPNCVDSDDKDTAIYTVTNDTANACNLIIRTGF